MEKNIIISILYEYYKDLLTQIQSDAIEQYYLEDLSLTEIAEQSGISKQAVSNNIKRAEAILFDLEEKLGLYKRQSSFITSLETIDQLVKEKLSKSDYHLIHSKINQIIRELS